MRDPFQDAGVPFGANEVRLNGRQWLATAAIVALALLLTPRLWERVEPLATDPDDRIPYDLSHDYWLYARRLRAAADAGRIAVLGDSVVWGEYVRPDGTLAHFLNRQTGETNLFVNAGLDGLSPLAQEGLVRDYGRSLRGRKVILHWNALWLTSPQADLSAEGEQPINHSRLVAQFAPRIPCYRAGVGERLSAAIERRVEFLAWVTHLQDARFGHKSIPGWTLADDGRDPPGYPNAWKNPLAQALRAIPEEPRSDRRRGPGSARHVPWTESGQFDWVGLDRSLQWPAFQRVVRTLRGRGNQVLVLVGPFNEHMMNDENRAQYRRLRAGVVDWLSRNGVPHVAPAALPSDLYADASHPLTGGYEQLAKRMVEDSAFQAWLKAP